MVVINGITATAEDIAELKRLVKMRLVKIVFKRKTKRFLNIITN